MSDYAIHAPNCTLSNILNCSKLMGGLLDIKPNKKQERCRVVVGDATINRALEVHRIATCNHTAITVTIWVVDGKWIPQNNAKLRLDSSDSDSMLQ
eukprot:scaffold16012_cov64-Cyclotella_meneghiniana.AAC.2